MTTRLWTFLMLAPLASVTMFALVAKREWAGLLVPVLGPWAGRAFGHAECTMGRAMPEASLGLCVLGAAALLGLLLARGEAARRCLAGLAVLWSLAWSALALLSVANTLE